MKRTSSLLVATVWLTIVGAKSCLPSSDVTCRDLLTCPPPEAGTGGAAGVGPGSGGDAASGASGAPLGGEAGASGGAAGSGGGEPCGGCDAAAPVCDVVAGECVECTESAHCSDPAPACSSGRRCVECVDDEQCSGRTPLCDATSNRCVECTSNDACTDPTAARCVAGTCAACTGNADCTHLEGTGVCDSGECVACTPEDAGACGSKPCNPLTRSCSAFEANRRTCESCDTDANCAAAGHHCVPTEYRGRARGGHCLKDSVAAGGCARPFLVPIRERQSLSGQNGRTYCGINEELATCEAVRALIDGQTCANGLDSDCPEGALCRTVGLGSNTCTYACGGAVECLATPTPGSGCGGGTPPAEPTYCGG